MNVHSYIKNVDCGKVPGGPMAKTPCFHCWGPRFNPWVRELTSCKSHCQKKKCTLQILEQLLKEKGKKKSVTNNPIMKIKCNHKKYSVKKKARKNNGAKQWHKYRR